MKKLRRKAMSAIMALTMLSGTAICTSANASEEEDTNMDVSYIMEMLATNDDSDNFYYTPYDYYDIYNVAPTDHYLSAIVPSGTNLPNSFGVYFYLNTNIISNTPTNRSNFSICPGYNGYATLNTVTSSSFAASCKSIFAKFNKAGNPALPAALFAYHLSGVESNNAINSEYNLHCMTSASQYSPSTALYTNADYSLEKVIYALGDVDRDGDVDGDDSIAVQKYILNIAIADPYRDANEAAYDKIAFELAADYDQNGIINLGDAISILQYANTH